MKGKLSVVWRVLIATVLVISLGLVMAVPASAAPAAGDVEVTVSNQTGTPISGATVRLFWDTVWKWMAEKTTNASGVTTFTAAEISAFGTAQGFTPTAAKFQVGVRYDTGDCSSSVYTWGCCDEMPCISYNSGTAYTFSYQLKMFKEQAPTLSYDNTTKELTVTYELCETINAAWLSGKTPIIGLFRTMHGSEPGLMQAFPDGAGGWNKYLIIDYNGDTNRDCNDYVAATATAGGNTISAVFDLDNIMPDCDLLCGDQIIAVPWFKESISCCDCVNCCNFYGFSSLVTFDNLIVMDDAGVSLLQPTTEKPITCKPGDNIEVKWFFHADCEPSQDFYIEVYKGTTKVSGYVTSTVSGTTICDCYVGKSLIPIDTTAPDGTYDIKIRSLCTECEAVDIEEDAVIVDATPPDVDLTAPDTTGNYKDCMDMDIEWTMSDAGGIANAKIEFSTTGCSGPWTTLATGTPGVFNYNPTTGECSYTHHVGTPKLDGINSCNFCIKVTVTDNVGLTNSDTSGAFTVDNQAPTVTITSPTTNQTCDNCLVGGEPTDIVFDYSDNCGPLTADIAYRDVAGGGSWTWIETDIALTGTSGTYTYSWLVPPTLDSCQVEIGVLVTDCPGNTDDDTVETCVTAPLILVDCETGWTWNWGWWCPENSNTQTSIMVVFNKPLDLDSVEILDFRVYEYDGEDVDFEYDITDMEVHTEMHCGAEWQGYTFVFLTVSPMMTTDATPRVWLTDSNLAGGDGVVVSDTDPVMTLGPLDKCEKCPCQDGIAPIIELSSDPVMPEYNDMVTITMVASEKLSEAYLFIGSPDPDCYYWNDVKPIGWPPRPPHQPEGEWLAHGWLVMEEGEDNTWTVSFRNKFGPDQPWFIEVAAHDFTQWGYAHEPPVDYPWKHEKWTEESLIFDREDVFFIELHEGWNLISVPRDLVDPSLAGFFGTGQNKAVTKAFYYTGGPEGTWDYAAVNPGSGDWFGTIEAIEPGKGYWVWCSPPRAMLLVKMSPINPLVPPPSYKLDEGWNMIGVTMLNPTYFVPWGTQWMYMHDYLSSLGGGEHGNAIWSVLYWYTTTGPGGAMGWLRTTPNSLYELIWWFAFGPEWACPAAIPGHGYWIFMNQSGILAP